MKQYIIDGNNLIGKIKFLKKVQQKDKKGSREKLSFLIDNYFHNKKAKVFIHFDGYEQGPIKPVHCKIIYSESKTADEKIKMQIGTYSNTRNLVVITSDGNLAEFAKVCSCSVMKSEEFAKIILYNKNDFEEAQIKKLENEQEEFNKIFGVNKE